MVRIPITDKSSQSKAAARGAGAESTIHQYSATATPGKPQSVEDADEPSVDKDVPDPTANPSEESEDVAAPNSSSDDIQSDPTVPPASQPVDSANHSLGKTAREVPGGADVTGGDLTEHQDADSALEEQQSQRIGEEDMQRRQAAGEVETQTKDLKPHPSNPQEGLPPNPTGRENTGGTTPADAGNTDGGNADGSEASANGATTNTLARAATEHDERFLQLAADFENYKRQVARRESEVRERAVVSVLEDILPVLDNFELAVKSAQNARDVEQVRIGVEYILQQLKTALQKHGIETIEAQGRKFDPLQHDALEEVQETGQPEGTVVEETQRGYAFKGRVLRPSRVKVAGGKK